MKKYDCAIIDKDIPVLAKKTVDFLNNHELQKEMRQKALFAKDDLAWDNLIVNLINFFKGIE